MIKIKIKTEFEIERDVIEDIITTAIEGGSNYWYYIDNKAIKIIRSVVPFKEDSYISSSICKAMFDHNMVIPINDAENEDEVLGHISVDGMKLNLQKLCDDGHFDKLQQHMTGDGDAESADIIFQYMVLGDIVFG